MIRRHGATLRALLFATDALIAAAVALGLHELRFTLLPGEPAPNLFGTPALALLVYALAWPAILAVTGQYRLRARWSFTAQAAGIGRSLVWLAVLLFAALFLTRTGDLSRAYVLLLLPAQGIATVLGRLALHLLLARLRGAGRNTRYLLVVGGGADALALTRRLERQAVLGLSVVGLLDDDPAAMLPGVPHLGPVDAFEEILRREVVDEVALCLPPADHARADAIATIAQEEGKIVRLPLPAGLPGVGRALIEDLDGLPVLSLVRGPDRAAALAVKRVADLAGALLLLVLLAPLILLIALRIRLADGAPVLFSHERVGRHGRRFTLWKFRTMVPDAEERLAEVEALNATRGAAFKAPDDPRVTPTGRFLRRTGLDELPQLWNVVRGEMSLVGPRPAPPREVDGYAGWHRRRLSVRPGITGLWQVTTRLDEHFDDRAALDLDYIDRWSLWLDLRILIRTIPAVLRQEGS